MTAIKKQTKQALVMLVKHDDGSLTIIDANQKVHDVTSASDLMHRANAILESDQTPQVESEPGKGPSVAEKEQSEQLEHAFGVLGDKLKEVAAEEYGAPVVNAASTVLAATTQKATGVIRKLSRGRKRSSGRYSSRRKQ